MRICLWLMLLFAQLSYALDNTANNDRTAKLWFEQEYAPVWLNHSSLNAQAMLTHFTPNGAFRLADGRRIHWQGLDDFASFVAQNLDAGWIKSKLIGIEETQLTTGSSTLLVLWQSQYGDKRHLICEWYLLDQTTNSAQWLIAAIAQVPCPPRHSVVR